MDFLQEIANWPSAIGLLGTVATIAGTVLIAIPMFFRGSSGNKIIKETHTEEEMLRHEVDHLRNDMTEIQTTVKGQHASEIDDVRKSVSDLQSRLERLTDLIIVHFRRNS